MKFISILSKKSKLDEVNYDKNIVFGIKSKMHMYNLFERVYIKIGKILTAIIINLK